MLLVRMMRDPFVTKSNYISYATHASWQQEIWAAAERSRKHSIGLAGRIDRHRKRRCRGAHRDVGNRGLPRA